MNVYESIIDNVFGLQSSGKLPKNEEPQNVKETTSEVKKPDGGKYSWFPLSEKGDHLVYHCQVSMLEAVLLKNKNKKTMSGGCSKMW